MPDVFVNPTAGYVVGFTPVTSVRPSVQQFGDDIEVLV